MLVSHVVNYDFVVIYDQIILKVWDQVGSSMYMPIPMVDWAGETIYTLKIRMNNKSQVFMKSHSKLSFQEFMISWLMFHKTILCVCK